MANNEKIHFKCNKQCKNNYLHTNNHNHINILLIKIKFKNNLLNNTI